MPSVEIPCAHCGKPLIRTPYRAQRSRAHFCDPVCKSAWQGVNRRGENNPRWKGGLSSYTCQQCGKAFESKPNLVNKFCSVECHNKGQQVFQDIEKTCARCGKKFTYHPIPSKPDKVCCSRTCSNGYRSDLHNQQKQYEIRQCAHCGNEFEVRNPGVICCSVACSNRLRSDGKEIVKCEECGKTFEDWARIKRRFCTTDCHRRNINKQRYGPRRQLTCVVCGKTFSPPGRKRQSKCCSIACRGVYYSGPNSPTWKGGWSPYYGPNWNRQRRKARIRDNHTCVHCGITEAKLGKALDVHHLQPFRTFDGDYIRANALENLISACGPCHKLLEYNRVPIQPKLI